MKAYFTSLNPREQKMLLAAGFIVLLFLPYQFIYTPFQDNLLKMELKVNTAQQNVTWMKNKAIEVRKLQGGGSKIRTSRQSLLTLIETTTKKNNLKISKVQPTGSSKVQVRLEKISFNNMMQWLDGLVVLHGLTIEKITIEKQEGKGIVNARINMKQE